MNSGRALRISIVLAAAAPALALAQHYPAKPVLVIVPLAAASASDVAVRTLTERLSTALKQQVVVENQRARRG